MGFLLRSAFWFSGVLLLLPFGEVGDERSVGPVDTFFAAKAALSDVGALCDRQPQACTVGKAALETIGLRARESARVAYEVLDERFGDTAPALTTGSVPGEDPTALARRAARAAIADPATARLVAATLTAGGSAGVASLPERAPIPAPRHRPGN